ncbi:MAG: YjdF family protein, partial [Oscillospiraceae bacterium]|nr:YjdF family protein [Oscillospiraceae bacterium]
MEQTTAKLTVFFDPPFWAGLYEREQRGSYEACRIVFGAEPKDYEVYDYLLKNYGKLRFSPAIEAGRRRDEGVNPKRLQREIRRQLQSGT